MNKFLSITVALLATAAMTFAGDDAKPAEVTLQGKLGCSHCTYHKGKGCAVGFETKDGKIYVLDKADKDLMKARNKGGEIKVTGTVTEKDGYALVHASKAELVK